MRQFFAAVLLVAGVGGTFALWAARSKEPAFDEAAVNRRVDARLHQVLLGLLDKERQSHALAVHP